MVTGNINSSPHIRHLSGRNLTACDDNANDVRYEHSPVSEMAENPRTQFEKAFEAYSDELYRYCFFRLGERERAEELVQEAFMKSWQAVAAGGQIENLRAYLYRSLHNMVVNEYRDRKHHSSLEALAESQGFEPAVEDDSERLEDVKAAIELLDRLDPPYKEVMVLRYVNDLPVKDIAHILKESETSISVKIHRAIKKLQKIIDDEKML